jgi:glycosyltransferase involved in cell wall biosynthesis
MARMPVITADHGGMAELSERFGNAALFRAGDARDLERVLRRFLDEPGIWTALQARRGVRTVAHDVDGLLKIYGELAERKRAER